MKLNLECTKKAVEAIFGNTEQAEMKLYGSEGRMKNYPFGVYTEPYGDGATMWVGFKGYANLMKFTISPYPACCGINIFHHFSVDQRKVTQDQLDTIMAAFIEENKYVPDTGVSAFAGHCNRLEVIMVEDRTSVRGLITADTELEPVENPKITYQSFWNFFHKYAKKVRTRLQYNTNSYNVLHNMEVLF